MNDTFIITSLNYIKDLKNIKKKNYYINNIIDKELYLSTYSFSDYEKVINNLILEVNNYIINFEKKFTDTYQLHKKEYKEFNNLKDRILDSIKFEEPMTFENIKEIHKIYIKLAKKCISNEVYNDNDFRATIRIKNI